jgi:tRNA (mo5U34)-methyltransferase
MIESSPNLDEIRRLIAAHGTWYHRIELRPGLFTPGLNDTAANRDRFDRVGLPLDFTGLRVLDIGCADGYFSFLAEQRGAADVVAVDYRRRTSSGFDLAHRLLGSQVRFHDDNVYNLTPEKYGTFDVVLLFGVLYHLRNPLLALDAVRAMMRSGGRLFAETHIIDDAIQLADGTTATMSDVAPRLQSAPIWQFYKGASLNGDITNKWAPNMTGFRHIVEEARFEVVAAAGYGSRGCLHALAIEDATTARSQRLDTSAGL